MNKTYDIQFIMMVYRSVIHICFQFLICVVRSFKLFLSTVLHCYRCIPFQSYPKTLQSYSINCIVIEILYIDNMVLNGKNSFLLFSNYFSAPKIWFLSGIEICNTHRIWLVGYFGSVCISLQNKKFSLTLVSRQWTQIDFDVLWKVWFYDRLLNIVLKKNVQQKKNWKLYKTFTFHNFELLKMIGVISRLQFDTPEKMFGICRSQIRFLAVIPKHCDNNYYFIKDFLKHCVLFNFARSTVPILQNSHLKTFIDVVPQIQFSHNLINIRN